LRWVTVGGVEGKVAVLGLKKLSFKIHALRFKSVNVKGVPQSGG